MKITITKAHYDAAVAVPWNTTTCIVAQAVMEATGEEIKSLGSFGMGMLQDWRLFKVKGAETLQDRFDNHHSNHGTPAAEVLVLLPLEVELIINP